MEEVDSRMSLLLVATIFCDMNGEPKAHFHGQQGISKMDPLFPCSVAIDRNQES